MFHLIRRFFGHISARSLSPLEQDLIGRSLKPDLAKLFFMQPSEDQRHALTVLERSGSSEPDLVEAALLHDVGKTASRLGPVGRSLATIAGLLGLPVPTRWKLYLDHGRIGAKILSDAGASPLAIAFSLHHPGAPPPGIDRTAWSVLEAADNA